MPTTSPGPCAPGGPLGPPHSAPHPGPGAEFALREPFDVHAFATPQARCYEGIVRLADAVFTVHPWDALQQATRRVVSLLARMIGYRKGDTATWHLPARDDAAARARTLVSPLSGLRQPRAAGPGVSARPPRRPAG